MPIKSQNHILKIMAALIGVLVLMAVTSLATGEIFAYADGDEGDQYYHVTINVKDEDGSSINEPDILFERIHTSYMPSMKIVVQPENGVFKVDCGEGFEICYIEVSAQGYEKKIKSFDPREMAAQGSREVSLDISLKRARDPNRERNLSFRVIDSSGNDIPGASLVLERNKRGYVYYQVEPTSGMNYTVKESYDTGEYFWQYRFRASASGYQSVTGEDFSFKSAYYNSYFDPATNADPIVVNVRLKSNEEVLNEAKQAAIDELKRYKDRASYREAEQQEYDRIIEEKTGEIQNAPSHSAVNSLLSEGKRELDELKTSMEYLYEELRKNITFRSASGRTEKLDDNGMITLTDTDSGTFYLKKEDGSNYTNNGSQVKWHCEVKITSGSSYSYNFIIGSTGEYQPRVTGGPFDATVYIRDLNITLPFKVKVVKEEIDELKAYVDGKDVSGSVIHVSGSEEKKAVIRGHIKGTTRWIALPINAVEFESGGAVSVDHSTGLFRAWGSSGKMTYSLTTDPWVKVSFDIISDPVPVTGLDVYVPAVNYIDYWDTLSGQFTGILEGDPDEKDRYHVTVFPETATNPSVVWEALTPEIATQSDVHSAGIVPKKAGDAKFIVRSVENPSVFKMVTVKFRYRNPLRTAEPEEEVYYLKKGARKDIIIITNGQKDSRKGASDQRFKWTYSNDGIAVVTDKMVSDVTLSGAKECIHTITAKKNGVIYVTGYPYDDSENCKPVRFKIVVSDDEGGDDDSDREAVKKVEDLINSIGKVTLDKEPLIKEARRAFNALTSRQKGMVNDGIYAKLVAAEQMLKWLKRQGDDGGEEAPGDESSGKKSGNDPGIKNPSGNRSSRDTGSVPESGSDPANPDNNGGPRNAGNTPGTETDTAQEGIAGPVADEPEDASENEQDHPASSPDADAASQEVPDYIEAREIDINELKEAIKEQARETNNKALLPFILFVLIAAFFGGQKKYREYRSETR